MSGNLSHQIEHHLFPDIPAHRYAEIAVEVREICERYGLPYTTGPLTRQYGQVVRRILRYALPGGASEAVPADVLSPASEPVAAPSSAAVADAEATPAPLAAAA